LLEKIKKMNKTFQVLIPFDSDRGGAESLYQLVYFLKKFNTKVSIDYTLNWRGFFKKKKKLKLESMEKYYKNFIIKKFFYF